MLAAAVLAAAATTAPGSTVQCALRAGGGRSLLLASESQHAGVWNQRAAAAVDHACLRYCSRDMHEERPLCVQHVHAVEVFAAEVAEAGSAYGHIAPQRGIP